MARKVKFPVTMAGLLKQATVLILLSAKVESLQCYWCGPLAEQVHRSQRAPSCDTLEDHVTACDPGYTHCAVVASSPPFAESRYCVKLYQDECYSLYCNTTNTYRMTCPCRGDLCNGPKTEREIDAFTILAKTVARTQNSRIKKRNSISTKPFVHSNKNKNTIIQNMGDTESDLDEDNVENDISENIKTSNLNETLDKDMQSDQPITVETKKEHLEEAANNITNIMKDEKADKTTPDKTAPSDHKVQEMPDVTTVKGADDNNKNLEMTTTTNEMTTPPTKTVTVEKFINNYTKTSMGLPTAEALQQNSGPMETSGKTVEHTTTESGFMTTLEINKNGNPTPTNATRNRADLLSFGTFLLINCLMVNLIM